MPLVFLKYPIVKHYAGSVFDLEEIFHQDEQHPSLYERMNPRRFYNLPDDGKGRNMELSISDTELCPVEILNEIDFKSGPGRITSIHSGNLNFEDKLLHTWTDSKILSLDDVDGKLKQIIQIKWPEDLKLPATGMLFDRKQNYKIGESVLTQENFNFDLSNLHPGFFEMQIQKDEKMIFRITFMKCFPLVVVMDETKREYRLQRAVW